MPLTRLLLARHGQTEANLNEVFQGQGGGPLNPTGRAEAALLAKRLTSRGIAKIVSSDLVRAVETAAIVGELVGVEPSADSDLREIDVGEWSGVSYVEVATRFPDEYKAWRTGVDVRRGGGETYGELAQRMRRAIDRIVASSEGTTVLVVSHGAALRALGCSILGLVPPGLFTLGAMRNTAMSVATFEDGNVRLSSWNDAAHLET